MVPNPSALDVARPTTGSERVRRVLSHLSEQSPTITATGTELATLAHFSREATSRELARLQRAGVIRRDGPGVLTVVDRDALEA